MTREHHSIHRVDITPDRESERKLFKEACATVGYARVTFAGIERAFVVTEPADLRFIRDLFDTLASRMEALQRAQVLTRTVEIPETPPGA